ncbi:MAG: PAS domain S-box protein [Myxococcota bacterium]|nr:PAS domain S-box protein [Myxococcota bacterium]
MTDEDTSVRDASELRRRAEAAWNARAAGPRRAPTEAEALRLIHELEVHQIELEMQFEELREANAKLAAERERYRELYDFAPAGYVTLDREGTISDLNVTGASLLGADAEQLTGKRLGMFVAEAERGNLHEMLREILDTGMPASRDLALRDGRERSLRLEGVPGAQGSECRASFWDTSDIRRAERALRLRDRAMHSVSQGILITDPNLPDNPVIYANPSLERTTGYTLDEVDGRSWHFLVGEDTDTDAIREIDEAFTAGRVCSIELLCYRKDGTTYRGVLHVTPVHDETGHVTEFVIIQVDVSERRTLEEALARAQRMEAVGRLSGGIAHDFNNLLMIIGSAGELAGVKLDDPDPDARASVRESLRAIAEAVARAAELTRQLLGFSRKHVTRPVVLAVNHQIEASGVLWRRLIRADIDLKLSIASRPSYVKMDPGQLEQVLLNLVVNARDAMPDGGTIEVETEVTELSAAYCKARDGLTPGSFVRIRVTDDGHGMDAATKARVFEPFFTTKEVGRGTGLGLSTAYWVVKRNGGDLSVESEVGRGSTFVVLLPLTDERPAPSSIPPPLPRPIVTETVLLAEDQPTVRALVGRVIEGLGYVVLSASDGVAALELLAAHEGKIHALVTDVVMPRMGGRQLAERVRALRPGTPILFMSGYTDDPSLFDGIPPGESSFLQKPFAPDALGRALRKLLASAERAAEVDRGPAS